MNKFSNGRDIYQKALLNEIPRVLGWMDREPSSPTCGCMDRTYWAWKFTDFPGARFQEGLCALSFMVATEFAGNIYVGNSRLVKWIEAGFDYWSFIQYPDGSFDEAYPFERSLAATAFTSFYLSEAYLYLNGRLSESCSHRFKKALAGAAQWLCNNDEKHGFISNHLAAASASLYHAYRICEDERFEKRSRYFLDKILSHQSDEGWYDEYGGADPGYQTHGSFYLARLFELSEQEVIIQSLERSFEFLAQFVHPDRSLGGEYASRNTQTYYPAAFEMMASTSKWARWISDAMLPAVDKLDAAGLGSIDAYNYFPLLNNTVFAFMASLNCDRQPSSKTAMEDISRTVFFKNAGIAKIATEHFEAYVGTQKGGVLKAFNKKKQKLVLNDCGYIGRQKNGKLITNQVQDDIRPVTVNQNEIRIGGNFAQFKRPVMTPITFLGFRVFNLTFGRVAALGYWLKSLLVKVLIYRRKSLNLNFERRITWNENSLSVRDRIQGDIGDQLDYLHWQDLFTTIHMGSSRYFIPNELNKDEINAGSTDEAIDLSKLKEGVVLERTVKFP